MRRRRRRAPLLANDADEDDVENDEAKAEAPPERLQRARVQLVVLLVGQALAHVERVL